MARQQQRGLLRTPDLHIAGGIGRHAVLHGQPAPGHIRVGGIIDDVPVLVYGQHRHAGSKAHGHAVSVSKNQLFRSRLRAQGLQGIPQSQGMRLDLPGLFRIQPAQTGHVRQGMPGRHHLFALPQRQQDDSQQDDDATAQQGGKALPVQGQKTGQQQPGKRHQKARAPQDLLTHVLPSQMAGQPHLQGAEHTAARDAQHHARHEPQQGAHRPGQLLSFFEQYGGCYGCRGEQRDGEGIIAQYVRKALPDIMPVLAVTQGAHLGKKPGILDRRCWCIRKKNFQIYNNGNCEAQQIQQAQARVAPQSPVPPEQEKGHEEHGSAHEGADRMHQHGTA